MKAPVFKALRRFLVCAVVITALLTAGLLLLTPETAVAAPCCSFCDARLDKCVLDCGGGPACDEACLEQLASCYRFCIFCF